MRLLKQCNLLILCLLLHISTRFFAPATISASTTPSSSLVILPPDAVSLLSFKSKADLDNKLLYTIHERFDYCLWQGVKCRQGRVVRYVLQGFGLRGQFPPHTVTRLDQLRVLSLKNNSLSGPIPDLSPLLNLKSLFLDHNYFSATFPPSLLALHRLLILDLSHNNLAGSIPSNLTVLDRLNYLRLDANRFNGSIPPLNQTALAIFNVSDNNLTGPVPVTPTLKKFTISSFLWNPGLCGDVINKPCRTSPFFYSPPVVGNTASPPLPLLQSSQSQGAVLVASPSPKKRSKIVGVILGIIVGVLISIAAVLIIFSYFKRPKEEEQPDPKKTALTSEMGRNNEISTQIGNVEDGAVEEKKIYQVHETESTRNIKQVKSGDLAFCNGEAELYTLELLMKASAELLGRGTIGTTYKAVLDNQLIVTVKRVDACKTAITSAEAFAQHLEAVGVLRHPNLVPVRAYFQAEQERLIVYDYQPNGSLFNLIHGKLPFPLSYF